MTTHTPGPWFTEATSTIGHVAVCDSDGFTICNPSPMGAANARLIAAAPDLLAALKHALDRFESIPAHQDEAGIYRHAAAIAQAAIAKATGE